MKFPQQNIKQSELGICKKKLSVELYVYLLRNFGQGFFKPECFFRIFLKPYCASVLKVGNFEVYAITLYL